MNSLKKINPKTLQFFKKNKEFYAFHTQFTLKSLEHEDYDKKFKKFFEEEDVKASGAIESTFDGGWEGEGKKVLSNNNNNTFNKKANNKNVNNKNIANSNNNKNLFDNNKNVNNANEKRNEGVNLIKKGVNEHTEQILHNHNI
ncbi:hypothetical protein ABK040_008577 [Willaertia magna]